MTGVHRTALATTFLVAILSGSHAVPEAQGPPQQPPGQERRRVVVEFAQFGPDASAAVRVAGGQIAHEFPQFRKLAAWLPEPALAALRSNPNVLSIDEDPLRFPFAETVPYGISMVQADLVTEPAESSRKVCIIDSGYSRNHPDLPVNVTGVDDIYAGPWWQDRCGHGTHVAGTIAALKNTEGVVGVMPEAIGLHIVKVFGDDCGWAYASDLAAAVNECRAVDANIINMSLGGSVPSNLERDAFDVAYAAGVLSVAAAGNGGNTAISYPAGYGSVVSVAAVDDKKALASFSQRNVDVELAAPGVNVLSTVPWLEQNSVTAAGVTYPGTWMELSGRTGAAGITGELVSGGLCDSVGTNWAGRIVLCERGIITYYDKVTNVRTGGGTAAVIYNNVAGDLLGLLVTDSPTPAIGITRAAGLALAANGVGRQATFVSYFNETGGSYEAWSGTSMATPHVAGVAALIWSRFPDRSAAQVRNALIASAEDLGVAGRDTSFGYGLVQAKAALARLEAAEQPPSQPPTAITLTAVRRGKRVDLSWTTTSAASVTITRNQDQLGPTSNDGSYTDSIGGKGTYTYRVCEVASVQNCSNFVSVVF